MSTKARLISTISAICMILALLVTGVWAVSTANITLGGTVTFTADNINATITGSITGTADPVSITPLVYRANKVPGDTEKNTWNNDISFDANNLITMKVHVKNDSTERSLFVKVTDNTTTTNINKDFSSTVTNVGSGDTYEVVAGGEIEYTLTLSVDELDYSASATYALDVDLRDANASAEDPAPDNTAILSYSYNESKKQATVTGSTSNLVADINVPETVVHEGETYTVTAIAQEAFLGYANLKNVSLPDAITTIGDRAFKNCILLTEFDVPMRCESIGDDTFAGCVNFEKIDLSGTLLYYNTSDRPFILSEVPNLTVYVEPENSKDYRDHVYWGNFTIEII